MKVVQHLATIASSILLFAEFAAYNQYTFTVPYPAYALVLFYIVIVTFSGLFSLRIGDYYVLTPHQSSTSSLLQSAKILTALTPAAMFNFLKVCHIQSSQFEAFMNRLPLQTVWLVPATLALIIAVNYWGLWTQFVVACGMEELALSTLVTEEKLTSGRAIL